MLISVSGLVSTRKCYSLQKSQQLSLVRANVASFYVQKLSMSMKNCGRSLLRPVDQSGLEGAVKKKKFSYCVCVREQERYSDAIRQAVVTVSSCGLGPH